MTNEIFFNVDNNDRIVVEFLNDEIGTGFSAGCSKRIELT